MADKLQVFNCKEDFALESGHILHGFHLSYTTHGRLNAGKNNVVWIFHALTANSNAAEWWPGLVGENQLFNPAEHFIICVNMPGSCYGSTGPLDINPENGQPFYHDFPFFTTRDMVRSFQYLRQHLGIEKILIGIGGSMGGQQCLEWAIEEPDLFEYIIPMATNAFHSPWGIAFNASQRMSIEADGTWTQKAGDAGLQGMKVARSMALISYRNYITYEAKQSEDLNGKIENFKPESYQRYQGEKLSRRFNAFSYYFLSKSMDAHHVGRGRGGAEAALSQIKAKTLTIGISTDILFPVNEQEFLAQHIPGATFIQIDSLYGHDGFLLEYGQIHKIINRFLEKNNAASMH